MRSPSGTLRADWREAIGRELREQRRSIVWLAETVDMSRVTIYKLLKGDPRSAVRLELLHRIALALSKPARWLFVEGEAAPVRRVARVNVADGAVVAGGTHGSAKAGKPLGVLAAKLAKE